jgi:integrase
MTIYRELKSRIEANYLSANKVSDMRFYLLSLIALETGARVSDLLKLEFSAINENVISYTNSKSKRKQNQIVSTNLVSHINRYKSTLIELEQFSSLMFYNQSKGSVLSRVTANRRSQKEFDINFHQLRKESGRNVASQRGVVLASKFLGHSKVSTTDIYLNISDNDYLKQMTSIDM